MGKFRERGEEEELEVEARRFQEWCQKACGRSMKVKNRQKRIKQDWWNAELERSRRETRRRRRSWQEEGEEEERSRKKEEYISSRKRFKQDIREAKKEQMREMIEGETDPWKVARRLIKEKEINWSKRNIIKEDGTYTESEEEAIRQYMEKYFPRRRRDEEEELEVDREREYEGIRGSEGEGEIMMEEVKTTIGELKKGKAVAEDGIPGEAMAHVMAGKGEYLLEIYNRCLREGTFPKVWKDSRLVWIPKSDGGLRPINITPVLGKVLDKLIKNRINYRMEVEGRWINGQFGFRNNRGTIMACKKVVAKIKGNKEKGEHTLIVTMDIKNAFNSVSIKAIGREMRRMGMDRETRRICEFATVFWKTE